MDINICIDRLGLNRNMYRLTEANPPHSIEWWEGLDPQPTEAELQAVWDAYVAEEAATQYQRLRAPEYPPIGDQLDALLKEFNYRRMNGEDLVADLDSVLGDWLAVKARHPKPE